MVRLVLWIFRLQAPLHPDTSSSNVGHNDCTKMVCWFSLVLLPHLFALSTFLGRKLLIGGISLTAQVLPRRVLKS